MFWEICANLKTLVELDPVLVQYKQFLSTFDASFRGFVRRNLF